MCRSRNGLVYWVDFFNFWSTAIDELMMMNLIDIDVCHDVEHRVSWMDQLILPRYSIDDDTSNQNGPQCGAKTLRLEIY